MMKRFRNATSWLAALGLAGLVGFTGCTTQETTTPAADEPAPQRTGLYGDSGRITGGIADSNGNTNYNSLYFPNITAGPVVLEKVMPASVNAGQSFTYEINVYNTSSVALSDVKVTETLAEGFTFESASPEAANDGGSVTWTMDRLAPNSMETVSITGQASDEGTLDSCATVVFVPSICVTTTVVKPDLALTKTMPTDVLICDIIPVTYTITNPGSGTLTDVTVTDPLPDGLVTVNGNKEITFTLDSLAPGEERAFAAELKAESTGEFTNTATASAGGLEVSDSANVVVRQPVLEIDKTGPERQYLGRDVTYTISVTNTGDAVAANTILTDALMKASFVSASANGTVDSDGNVVWNLGDLEPGATQEVTLTAKPNGIGKVTNTAMVNAVCASEVEDEVVTNVVGIPAVLLEVIDEIDPVEVGETTTYVLTVTNQGSAVDTNIALVCELEAEMEFVSAGGATQADVQGNTVTFKPLAELAAKDVAVWRVTVKAAAAGDVRFSVKMDTDNIGREVIETEATNFYQ